MNKNPGVQFRAVIGNYWYFGGETCSTMIQKLRQT